jgi:hypothetical protein
MKMVKQATSSRLTRMRWASAIVRSVVERFNPARDLLARRAGLWRGGWPR